ncbi:hypothetical protein GLAREA_04882 [Glarea lozoyensis ATCC 20868]|uniref:Uncharacterized protein n=1 Tax=Glarea lozoyensis (strain ATCC 20868 / MF5171) TaxID=1116229 RepID=S3D7V1_GLAL2|nr:uncharacterized protein GLAREA_04882 [Glarea lozoyensis ATCC 20868]EPE28091.1 hypothetical protein GLAREA_04882 [Glarea lozoyensis ATCC 20868]
MVEEAKSDDFHNAIRELRLAVERLEARIGADRGPSIHKAEKNLYYVKFSEEDFTAWYSQLRIIPYNFEAFIPQDNRLDLSFLCESLIKPDSNWLASGCRYIIVDYIIGSIIDIRNDKRCAYGEESFERWVNDEPRVRKDLLYFHRIQRELPDPKRISSVEIWTKLG